MAITDVLNKIISFLTPDDFSEIKLTKTELKSISKNEEAKNQIKGQIELIKHKIDELEFLRYMKEMEKETEIEPTTEELIEEYNKLVIEYQYLENEIKGE